MSVEVDSQSVVLRYVPRMRVSDRVRKVGFGMARKGRSVGARGLQMRIGARFCRWVMLKQDILRSSRFVSWWNGGCMGASALPSE